MRINISRLLNNIYKNDKQSSNVLDSIEAHNKGIGAKTPIPNQALPTLQNNSNDDLAQMIFTPRAYYILKKIRKIDKLIYPLFRSKNLTPPPLNFYLSGYKDFDGDIVIDQIYCPIIDAINKYDCKSHQEVLSRLLELDYETLNQDTIGYAYDSMRLEDFSKVPVINASTNEKYMQPIGTHSVVLIGKTRTQDNLGELATCCNLKELAESVIPDVEVKCDNLISGTLLITPQIQVRTAKNSPTQSAYTFQPGSLECSLITYIKSNTTHKVQPCSIDNIARAIGITPTGEKENISISTSPQNITNISRATMRIPHTPVM